MVKILEEQQTEHDLQMVAYRFETAVKNIIASGGDITPFMAYQLEFIDKSRRELDDHISNLSTNNPNSG